MNAPSTSPINLILNLKSCNRAVGPGHFAGMKFIWDHSTIIESSEIFINDNKLVAGQFRWHQWDSAFPVFKSDNDSVCKYILSHPDHNKKVSLPENTNNLWCIIRKQWKNKVNKVLGWGLITGATKVKNMKIRFLDFKTLFSETNLSTQWTHPQPPPLTLF